MIDFKNKNDFEDLINIISEKLNITIDPTSLDVKLFKIFYELNRDFENKITEKVNSMFFENLKGNDLDTVMDFFDSYRKRGGSTDIYEFSLYNKKNIEILIEKNCLINFEKNTYKVLENNYINNGENRILAIKISNENIENGVFTFDGLLKLESKKIQISNTAIDEITKSIKLHHFKTISNEIESDFEFKNRSKSIMQSLGHSNNKIIKTEIMKNKKVKNIVTKNIEGITNFIVIPYKIMDIDELIIFSKEIVEYFNCTGVIVDKPNIIKINIEGLSSLIFSSGEYNLIIEEIISEVKNYLESNLNSNISRSKIINIIQDILNIRIPNNDYNYNLIKIVYSLYNKNNYDEYIVMDEIKNIKKVPEDTIISFGNIR